MRIRQEGVRSERIGWIALTVMILTSATYNSFAKQLSGALSPLSLLVLSELLTAFFVVLAFGVLPTLKRLLTINRKSLLPLLALGLLNGVFAPLAFFTGLEFTTAVNAELFSRLEMVMLLVLSVSILREEHLKKAHFIAGFCILSGIAFVALRGFSERFSFREGDFLIFLSAILFAGGNTIFKKYLARLAPELVIVSRASVAVAAFFIASLFIQHPLADELHAFPFALIPALLGFGFLSRFLNLFSFYESIERIPISSVSLFSSLNIIFGVIFASLYLQESIAWYHIIGGCMIVLGTLLLQLLGVHKNASALEQHMRQHHRQHL